MIVPASRALKTSATAAAAATDEGGDRHRNVEAGPLALLGDDGKESLPSSFNRLLLNVTNRQVKLKTLASFVSTLGGGYFYVKQLKCAGYLARLSRWLATEMGAAGLQARALLNQGYCLIHSGRFGAARSAIRESRRIAEAEGMQDVVKLCRMAVFHSRRMETGEGRGERCFISKE